MLHTDAGPGNVSNALLKNVPKSHKLFDLFLFCCRCYCSKDISKCREDKGKTRTLHKKTKTALSIQVIQVIITFVFKLIFYIYFS